MRRKKFLTMVGVSAIALIFLMNVSNAVNHYGILKNNLWTQVYAQGSNSREAGRSTGGNPYDPCETKYTYHPVVFEDCDAFPFPMPKVVAVSWTCINFGKSDDCFHGYKIYEFNCGIFVSGEYSNSDHRYTCFL